MTTKAALFTIISNKRNTDLLHNGGLVEQVSRTDSNISAWLTKKPFRVVELETAEVNGTNNTQTALLANFDATLKVMWIGNIFLPQIRLGHVVGPKLTHLQNGVSGVCEIQRPKLYLRPTPTINLFDVVPHHWVKDRALVARAMALFNNLSDPHRLLFNSVFWDPARFERFCRQPSSMIGHHAEVNGNLRHTVEVGENIDKLCSGRNTANRSLAILSALLHDAGKADEYMSNGKGGWCITERGRLLGHKVTVLEWIITAVGQWKIELPQDHYESLLHILTAVAHAPPWMSLREPAVPESFLLSVADRLSGNDDLLEQTINPSGGFGRIHKHLKSAPFKVRG